MQYLDLRIMAAASTLNRVHELLSFCNLCFNQDDALTWHAVFVMQPDEPVTKP